MTGYSILIAFFSLFLVASLLIPVPMFPGSWIVSLFGAAVQEYIRVLSAIFNGLFYGGILWAVFVGFGKKLTESE